MGLGPSGMLIQTHMCNMSRQHWSKLISIPMWTISHVIMSNLLCSFNTKICKDYKDTTILDDVETKYHASSNLFLVVVFMCCDIGGFARFV